LALSLENRKSKRSLFRVETDSLDFKARSTLTVLYVWFCSLLRHQQDAGA
jgi:hypothetical protein